MTESPENLAPETGQATENGQGSETGQTNNWYEKFEGEDLGYIQSKGWNQDDGINKMFESYKNLEKLKGAPADKLIKLPDGEDGWDEVYQRLGKPETKDGYQFEPSEEMKLDGERMDWFKDAAYDLNLTKQQHENLVKGAYEYESKVLQQREEAAELERVAKLSELKDTWGNKYDERTELAKRAYRSFVDDEGALDKLEDAVGNVEVIKMFAKIGESISEDKLPNIENTERLGYSKEQASYDLKELKSEVSANKDRLAEFNSSKGKDWAKYQRLIKVINNG